MSTKNTIRTIYLYLFSLVGLTLTIIGAVMMVNIFLKTYIFKQANYNNIYSYPEKPPYLLAEYNDIELKKIEAIKNKDTEAQLKLTETQKQQIENWLIDYEAWKVREEKRIKAEETRDYTKEENQRNMATAISMIVIGFPVYLIHWLFITRDLKNNKE